MAKKTLIGIEGIAKKIKKCYIGISNDTLTKDCKVKKIYIGDDNGKARLVFSSGVKWNKYNCDRPEYTTYVKDGSQNGRSWQQRGAPWNEIWPSWTFDESRGFSGAGTQSSWEEMGGTIQGTYYHIGSETVVEITNAESTNIPILSTSKYWVDYTGVVVESATSSTEYGEYIKQSFIEVVEAEENAIPGPGNVVEQKDGHYVILYERQYYWYELAETDDPTIVPPPYTPPVHSHDDYGVYTSNAKAPTCSKTGYTGDICCAGCDTILELGTSIPAGGEVHSQQNASGTCPICGESHSHNWVDGECTECGYTGCEHVWVDGVCQNCGLVCEHDWKNADGKCTICEKTHSHDWSDNNGVCKTCGYECSHNWPDGWAWDEGSNGHYHNCTICGKPEGEPHNANGVINHNNGTHTITCDACWDESLGRFKWYTEDCSYTSDTSKGTTATHHACSICGHLEEHKFVNGICQDCGYVCEHDFSKYQSVDDTYHEKVCKYCGIDLEDSNSRHNYDDTGYCPDCQHYCSHGATKTPKPNGENTHDIVCSICHKVLETGVSCVFNLPVDEDYHKCECGNQATHNFTKGKPFDKDQHEVICADCKATSGNFASHNFNTNGYCLACEYQCEHTYGSKLVPDPNNEGTHLAKCVNCGAIQPSQGDMSCKYDYYTLTQHKCHLCDHVANHTYEYMDSEYHKCSACKHTAPHEPNEDGWCEICQSYVF